MIPGHLENNLENVYRIGHVKVAATSPKRRRYLGEPARRLAPSTEGSCSGAKTPELLINEKPNKKRMSTDMSQNHTYLYK